MKRNSLNDIGSPGGSRTKCGRFDTLQSLSQSGSVSSPPVQIQLLIDSDSPQFASISYSQITEPSS